MSPFFLSMSTTEPLFTVRSADGKELIFIVTVVPGRSLLSEPTLMPPLAVAVYFSFLRSQLNLSASGEASVGAAVSSPLPLTRAPSPWSSEEDEEPLPPQPV